MYETVDSIYPIKRIEKNLKTNKVKIVHSRKPLYERNSVFVVESPVVDIPTHLLFNCMFKNAPELYKCDSCGFKVYLKINLKVHTETAHRLKIPADNFCAFSDANYNLTNILKCHSCGHCDFKTFSLLVMMKHELTAPCKPYLKRKRLAPADQGNCTRKTVQERVHGVHVVKRFVPKKWYSCDEWKQVHTNSSTRKVWLHINYT
jgi:hypothetical protein